MAYRDKIRRLCSAAMLLGVSLLLSYLEAILPLTVWLPLPAFKLGLANIVITLIFITVSPLGAAAVSVCRIAIMAMLFGNATSFIFSLSGGLLSYLGLWLLAYFGKRCFSVIGVSVGCAALHNIGQLIAAAVIFDANVFLSYLPALLIAALIFGTLTGALLQLILPRFKAIRYIRYN